MCTEPVCADAAFASACSLVTLLFKAVPATCDTASTAQQIQAGLQQLHLTAASGLAAAPDADVLQRLVAHLRCFTSSSGSSKGCSSAAAQPASELYGASTTNTSAALTATVPTLPAMPVASGRVHNSKRMEADSSLGADRDSSNSKRAKSAMLPCSTVRPAPDWADNKPGRWYAGDWYLQLGDTVFMQVAGAAAEKDSATFHVSNSSGMPGDTSCNQDSAHVWMFRVESFPSSSSSSSSSSISCRFYHNKQHELTQPLLLRHKAETLQDKKMGGIIYSLQPDSSSDKVLQQLPADVVGEVISLLYEPVDLDEAAE